MTQPDWVARSKALETIRRENQRRQWKTWGLVIGGLIVVSTVITYWYVAIPLAVIGGVIAVVVARSQAKTRENARLAAAAEAGHRAWLADEPDPNSIQPNLGETYRQS